MKVFSRSLKTERPPRGLRGRPSAAKVCAAIVAAAIVAAVAGGPVAAAILRVPEDYPTIQAAVDAAVDGDEIVVGPGTYRERIEIPEKSLVLRSSGGRDVTILDGEGSGTVLRIEHWVTLEIEGFTITGGSSADDGGGVCARTSNLSISSCRFTGNSAQQGGGLFYAEAGDVAITNSVFDNNIATRGPGVFLYSGSRLTVAGCQFYSNSGLRALNVRYVEHSSIESSVFRDNEGGAFATTSDYDVLIRDCIFENNQNPGGDGGGVILNFEASVTMERCVVRNNSARRGAGIWSDAHPFTIRDCVIEGNTAEWSGGGLTWFDGRATIERCVIRSNTAANAGGGVYGGSDIYEDNSLFRDCVIAGNEAGQGSQIALVGDGGGDVDTLTLTESAVEGGVKSIYIPGDQWLLFWGDGNTTLIPADLVSANVAFGTLISGGLAELRASDDLRLRARSGAGFAASEPNLIDLRIAAENIVNDPALMQIAIEARLNNPNGTARVRLRNWQAGQFEVIHIYSVGQSEATETIQNIPAASFVRSDDDQIELSIRMSTVATFSVQGFDAFFDLVEIRLE